MTATRSTPFAQRDDRDDLIAVDRRALRVNREHAIAVAVERDPEVEAVRANRLREQGEIGGAAAEIDVRTVRGRRDRCDRGAETLEDGGGDRRVGAVGTVDGDARAR